MTDLDRLKNFDSLPDDAIVPAKIASLITTESERTLRRGTKLKRVQLSERRVGYRVGDIRALVRGKAA